MGVGQLAGVRLESAPVEVVELAPPQRVAQMLGGEIPQGVVDLHHVHGWNRGWRGHAGRGGREPRGRRGSRGTGRGGGNAGRRGDLDHRVAGGGGPGHRCRLRRDGGDVGDERLALEQDHTGGDEAEQGGGSGAGGPPPHHRPDDPLDRAPCPAQTAQYRWIPFSIAPSPVKRHLANTRREFSCGKSWRVEEVQTRTTVPLPGPSTSWSVSDSRHPNNSACCVSPLLANLLHHHVGDDLNRSARRGCRPCLKLLAYVIARPLPAMSGGPRSIRRRSKTVFLHIEFERSMLPMPRRYRSVSPGGTDGWWCPLVVGVVGVVGVGG